MDYGYHRYFENGFWKSVKWCENQRTMADVIWCKFQHMAPMIKADAGKDVDVGKMKAGHWAWQLSIIAGDVKNAKTRDEALGFISTFRLSAAAGRDYQRRPEKQTALFTSDKWVV